MNFLGVGPLEFIFILLIVIIVLGPKDLAKTGRTLGRILREIITSQWWSGLRQTSREIKQLPNRLMREASIEDALNSAKEINTLVHDISQANTPGDQTGFQSWVNPVNTDPDHQINPTLGKHTILPKNTPIQPPGG